MAERPDLGSPTQTTTTSPEGAKRARRGPASRGSATPGLDSTLIAPGPPAGMTPLTSSDRLARLAASLPSVAPDAYEIGKEVAQGGIGRVLLARDRRLDRPVAIKELLVWNEAQEQRFVREALLTARLQHPSIVPIYEAGRWPDGEPFYAMKLVSGRTLLELITESKTLADRLALLPHVIAVAQAIAYAHSLRIIHRDLKPANVLVGEFGETVVIDWGLAKSLTDEDILAPGDSGEKIISGDGLTVDGSVVGTPAYMPPEQAAGKPVDERADVYALGAMLYHLIAAAPPYHDVPAQRLLRTITSEPPTPLDRLEPSIADELLAIANKAMARSRADRYRTAKELADDLHRFETGQIVAAHTYSITQILRRYVRRHRTALTVAASALFLIALIVVAAFIHTNEQRRVAELRSEEARLAEEAARTAHAQAEAAGRRATERADAMTLLQAEDAVGRDPNKALAWLLTLSSSFTDVPEMRRIAADAYAHGVSRALRGHTAYVSNMAVLPDGQHIVSTSDDKSVHIWNIATGEGRVLAGHTDETWNAAVLPDGARLVTTSKDMTARIWDIATGKELAMARTPAPTEKVYVRQDGVIVGSPRWEGEPWVWRPGAPGVTTLTRPGEKVYSSAFSLNGKTLVFQRPDGMAYLQDVDTGARRPVEPQAITPSAWQMNFDGDILLHETQPVVVWDLKKGTRVEIDRAGMNRSPILSHRGDLVATATPETIRVWDARTGAELHRLPGHGSPLSELEFSEDSRWLATGGYDQTVRTWDLTTGESQRYAGLRTYIAALVFLPARGTVAASSASGDIRIFSPRAAGTILTNHASPLRSLTVSSDHRVATIDDSGIVRITALDGAPIAEHPIPHIPAIQLLTSPDGRRYAAASHYGWDYKPRMDEDPDRRTLVLGTFDEKKPEVITLPEAVRSIAWAGDGGALFAGLSDGTVQAIDPDSSMLAFDRLPELVYAVASSDNGGLVAIGGQDGLVRVVNRTTGQRTDLGRHSSRVLSLQFSKDGQWLASGAHDHTLKLFRLEDGSVRSFDVGGAGVLKMAFSQDDSALYFYNMLEPQLRSISVETGELKEPIFGHLGPIAGFELSAGGERVLTYAEDGTARIVDLRTRKGRTLDTYRRSVNGVAFAAEGRLLLTAGNDGTLRAWPDDLPEGMAELRAWIEQATPDRIEEQ